MLLSSSATQAIYPNDLCVLAPTGSGKTLAYALPIVANLRSRIIPCCQALVILPVSDLAEQVYHVFKQQLLDDSLTDANLSLLLPSDSDSNSKRRPPAPSTPTPSTRKLRVALLSNKTAFHKEQALLCGTGDHDNDNNNNTSSGNRCHIDIVIATPGRLVDHIQKTSGFCLKRLRYLVLDECDRIMDQIKQNWLHILNEAVFGAGGEQQTEQSNGRRRPVIGTESLNANCLLMAERRRHVGMPLQKLLFSATLTRDPEQLEQMDLFQPLYFTVGAEKLTTNANTNTQQQQQQQQMPQEAASVDEQPSSSSSSSKQVEVINDLLSKKRQLDVGMTDVNVPSELSETFVQVVAQHKPLVAIYLLKTLKYRRMLCFVKSKESAQRLDKLLQLNGIRSMEYSASVHASRRKAVQAKFESDQLDVLVCSDVMARGMDLANVDYVLLYDAPAHLSAYIHKVGRTARAGRKGTAITLLEQKEVFFFKKMVQPIGSSSSNNQNVAIKDDQATGSSSGSGSQKPLVHKVKETKILKSKFKHLVKDYRESLAKLHSSLKDK